MSNFRSSIKLIGYDQEEAYFHQENKKLAAKLKSAKKTPESKNNVIALPVGRQNSQTLKKAA